MKVLSIIGTRPEVIKMAPVIKELSRYPYLIKIRVCVTGQRRELLDQMMGIFDITSDHNLNMTRLLSLQRDSGELALSNVKGISLIQPLGYLQMVQVQRCSRLILTDSGGLQEEAPSMGIPVLVLRYKTERPEALAAGAAKLVGTQKRKIIEEVIRLLDCPEEYHAMTLARSIYGDGFAAYRIAQALLNTIGQTTASADTSIVQ